MNVIKNEIAPNVPLADVFFHPEVAPNRPYNVVSFLNGKVTLDDINSQLKKVEWSGDNKIISCYAEMSFKDHISKMLSILLVRFLASLILFSGLINFLKFIIQMFYNRQRELGIRQCLGANWKGMFGLLFAEVFWTMSIALFLSLCLSEVSVAILNYVVPEKEMPRFVLSEVVPLQCMIYWGYFFSASKKFVFSQYPLSKVRVRADWYTLRGIGYGASGSFVTERSRTDFFAYGLYDIRPYESEDYDLYRLKVPHARFDLRVSNLTHITPRLDFRGVAEYSSDPYFVRDFFDDRFTADPEPATFAALEQQFDHLTAAFYLRVRFNDAYTTVEKIPEVLLLGQRQQIFDTPVYYQGDLSAGYYQMKWIDFDKKLTGRQGSQLRDYDSFRLDTTHFFYLPWKTPYFIFTPRAGFKMTAYSQTSEGKVREDDLIRMFDAASPTNRYAVDFNNYDDKGGSKIRWAGELGAELSTKIHNTWANLRSPLMGLDGLRHIMRPYANYTFINTPSVGKNHIYYFDEIDRLEKQSFFRFGLENRLQTREGNRIRNWLRLENFIDVHTFKKDDLNPVGEFCTLLAVEPIKGLTLSTEIMIDAGGNNEKLPDHYRHGRNVGRPGIDLKWLNRWNVSVRYEPVEDIVFTFAYDYIRPYNGRNPYSMGSTLTLLESTRWFNKSWYKHEETLSLGVQLPITPDRRTFLGLAMGYDFLEGHVSSYRILLRRLFHCVEVSAALAFEYEDSDWETSFSMGLRFTGLDTPILQKSNSVLTSAMGSGGLSL